LDARGAWEEHHQLFFENWEGYNGQANTCYAIGRSKIFKTKWSRLAYYDK
jgi:hypothetical protein